MNKIEQARESINKLGYIHVLEDWKAVSNHLDNIREALDHAEQLERALRNIKQHMELVTPTGYKLSGAINLANKALTPEADDGA